MGQSRRGTFSFLIISILLVLIATSVVFVRPAYAADDDSSLRTVRVGYYPMTNFQEYNETTGVYRGYSYDYMLAIAQYAGWKYEFVPVTYDEGIEMLENGELDLMNNVEMTDELSQNLSFSAIPSGDSCTCLVVSPDNANVAYEDYEAIGDLTVGLDYASSRNSGFVDYCKDNDCIPEIIYYHTAEGVEQGMADGEVNAYLVSSLQDVNMRTVAKFDTQSYYFATTKGNSDLLQELNTAMNVLKTEDPYFEEKIYAKYHSKSADEITVISDNEREYIAEQPTIKVAYDAAWNPVSYKDDDGNFSGAMASIFQLISDRTDLQFEFVPEDTYEQALADLSDGTVQAMAGFPYDYTWASKYNAWITTPFTTLTVFAANRKDNTTGNTVAVPAGSYLQYLSGDILQTGYSFANYGTTDACLEAVVNGSADYAFLDSYQLDYYRERSKYRNLSFKVTNEDDYRLSIAVSDATDERLYTIISKTLASVGSDEVNNIFRDTASAAQSRSVIDVLYSNPQVAGFLFTLLGFVVAVLISSYIYTKKMREKNRQLAVATNAKSEFLSNISHDMRTPLNGIIGYTDLATETTDPSAQADYLGKIKISGQFLLGLINDTLDISKIESGKLTINPEPVNGKEMIESIVAPIRQTAKDRGITFTVDTSRAKSGYIMTDKLSLQKIILNLLSNAVKYTEPGGKVGFTIETIEPTADGFNTHVIVEDNGIGISEDFLPEIFEPFSQEKSPQSRETVGTGLGLSIVSKLVALMNGKIDVKSQKGQGTRFDVYLPIEHLEGYEPPTASEAIQGRTVEGCTALLCEDNAFNREIAELLLKSFGMKVADAADGKAGVEAFATSSEGTFDVVLMDLRMPIMGGYEAACAIRALDREDARSVPIVALSADAYEDDIQKCQDAGMNGHVAKPIDKDALLRELIRQCGRPGDAS